ncbi:MAG: 30S ribosomal protein S8 [candidate division WWE3 bacterium]|nr:30S ribosomal protein S8 [candidate division WWE3 bacterium]
MVITDPIGDMLVSLKNGAAVGREEVVVPYSQVKENVADLLVREGFLSAVRKFRQQDQERFSLSLRQPKLEHFKRISKPGARRYAARRELLYPPQGIVIVSTSKGIMTHRQARKLNLGGELLAEVW